MSVLVTGATGFLGSHVVDALARRDVEVTAFARATSQTAGIEARGVKVVRGSFLDEASVIAACRGHDVVVHLAGGGIARSAAEIYRNNTGATACLARAAASVGVERFIFVSSLAAHGPSQRGAPAREDDPDAPRSHYGRSKLDAERALGSFPGRVTILRPPALYGPGEHRMVGLFRAAERGFVPMVHPTGTVSLLHGADCASAIARAVVAPSGGGRFYLAERHVYLRREMAHLIGAAVGRRVRVVPIAPPLLRAAAEVSELSGKLRQRPVMFGRDKVRDLVAPHQACDPTRASTALEWTASHDFAQAAVETYRDYQRRGWL